MGFGRPPFVDLDVGEAVGLVEGDQQPPRQDDEKSGDFEDLGNLCGIEEEKVCGVALVRVATSLKGDS